MPAVLLPIKDLRNSKQRLAGVLNPEERFGLAQTMLENTLRAVRGVRRAEKIFVVTSYQPAIAMAAEYGWQILREERQISESDSVDAASRICEECGVRGLLRLPLDLPLVPGCVSAEPGGMHYEELRAALFALAERTDVIGFDLVEVNPMLDVGTGVTSYLAAHTIVVFLARICAQPRWVARTER